MTAALPTDPWWIDAHLDLAYLDLCRAPAPRIHHEATDRDAQGLTLPALRRGGVRVALGTIFTEVGPESAGTPWGFRDSDDAEAAHAAGVRQLEVYEALERAGELRIVHTAADLDAAAHGDGPLGIVILMEGADPIRTPDEAAWWHARGVRVVGMAWARGSRWAGGNATKGPLTVGGRDLVQAFDALGILHDASHLSDEAFDGLCAASGARIVATHSNARALLEPSERHLRDDQAREIARRDGMVGLNLYGKFLASGRTATLDDARRHVEHAADVIGRDRLGLGSDFDGGFTPLDCPEGCRRPEELPALAHALAAHGWSTAELAGFMHGNWLRTLRAALSRPSTDR